MIENDPNIIESSHPSDSCIKSNFKIKRIFPPMQMKIDQMEKWKCNLLAISEKFHILILASGSKIFIYQININFSVQCHPLKIISFPNNNKAINNMGIVNIKDQELLVTVDDNSSVFLFPTYQLLSDLQYIQLDNTYPECEDNGTWSFAPFQNNQNKIAIGSNSHNISIFDLNTKEKISLRGNTGNIPCLSISSDGKYIANCSIDKKLIIFDIENNNMIKNHQIFNEMGWGVCWIDPNDIPLVRKSKPSFSNYAFTDVSSDLFQLFETITTHFFLNNLPNNNLGSDENSNQNLSAGNSDVEIYDDLNYEEEEEKEENASSHFGNLIHDEELSVPHSEEQISYSENSINNNDPIYSNFIENKSEVKEEENKINMESEISLLNNDFNSQEISNSEKSNIEPKDSGKLEVQVEEKNAISVGKSIDKSISSKSSTFEKYNKLLIYISRGNFALVDPNLKSKNLKVTTLFQYPLLKLERINPQNVDYMTIIDLAAHSRYSLFSYIKEFGILIMANQSGYDVQFWEIYKRMENFACKYDSSLLYVYRSNSNSKILGLSCFKDIGVCRSQSRILVYILSSDLLMDIISISPK